MVDIEALLEGVNPPYFANSKWEPGNPVYYSGPYWDNQELGAAVNGLLKVSGWHLVRRCMSLRRSSPNNSTRVTP